VAAGPPWNPPTGLPGSDVLPAEREGSLPRRRGWLRSTGIIVGLATVVALVWALGGFERRTDLLQPTAPGTLITVGPYELTFSEVTAQRKERFDDTFYWQLTAVGSGRTTGDEAMAPQIGETGTFASRDTRSGETQIPSGVRYGVGGSFTEGARFTPGLPPVPMLVEFEYAASYVPDATLRFVVFQLEYDDNSLIGGQDKTWNKTNHGFDLQLPVRVLPEEKG
jgi:hypothetical protein